MIRASYRRAGDKWAGVVRVGRAVLVDCGHEHDNRDMSTSAGTAATVCAREILDGARRPATCDQIAERKRTAYARVRTGAGFVQPTGWLNGLKDSCARAAEDYRARVAVVRAALPEHDHYPVPAIAPEPAEAPVGDLPEWMM